MSSYHPSLCPSYGMRKLQHCSAGTFQWDIHAGVCPCSSVQTDGPEKLRSQTNLIGNQTRLKYGKMTIKTPLVYFQFSDN